MFFTAAAEAAMLFEGEFAVVAEEIDCEYPLTTELLLLLLLLPPLAPGAICNVYDCCRLFRRIGYAVEELI